MLDRMLGILSGLVLLTLALALWRPGVVDARLWVSLGPAEGLRAWMAGAVAFAGGVMAIAALVAPGRRRPQTDELDLSGAEVDTVPSVSHAEARGSARHWLAGRIAAAVAAAEAAVPPVVAVANTQQRPDF